MKKTDLGIIWDSFYLVQPIWVVLENEDTTIHGLIWVDTGVIFVNVTVKGVLHTVDIGIKAEEGLVGFGIRHEEDISTRREKVWVNESRE